jgi:hypothetical protein
VTGQPSPRGLAKTIFIREAPARNGNSLLIDCGDTIQATPLESVYQSIARSGADHVRHRPAPPLLGSPPLPANEARRADARSTRRWGTPSSPKVITQLALARQVTGSGEKAEHRDQ